MNEWVFLAPALVFFIGYQVWPIVRVLWMSFTNFQLLSDKPAQWVGFDNYAQALHDPLMWASLGRAALFTLMFLPGTIILPLLLAILVDRIANQRLATVYRVILLIPAVIPSTLIFVLWKWMYNYQSGPINHLLVNVFGLFTVQNAPQWLGGTALTLPAIAIMEVWWGLGYHTIFFIAGLASIPKELSDAARIDGANEWQVFWHVIRPGLAPIMMILRRVALRLGDGGDRRISDLRRLQSRFADLHLDDFHVRPGVQDRALASRLWRLHRHDWGNRHDDRHGGAHLDLPSERLKMTLEADRADINTLREEPGSSIGTSALRHVIINLVNLAILLPLAWVLIMSVKSLPDAMQGNLWPKRFDFTHYSFVFQHIATLPVNLFNSIYVTAATVLLTTTCAVLAGYALVHIRPFGSGLVVTALLISLYFPVRVVSIISIYETQHWLGLINNTSGLILPYVTLQLAISILIMRSMFQLVPHEMFEIGEDRRGRPLAGAVGGRPAHGAEWTGRDLHRQFCRGVGRIFVVSHTCR